MEINVKNYSERSFVVFGEGTKEHKEKLMEFGGGYNRFLKNPDGTQFSGWIFAKSKKLRVIDWMIMSDIEYKDLDDK